MYHRLSQCNEEGFVPSQFSRRIVANHHPTVTVQVRAWYEDATQWKGRGDTSDERGDRPDKAGRDLRSLLFLTQRSIFEQRGIVNTWQIDNTGILLHVLL